MHDIHNANNRRFKTEFYEIFYSESLDLQLHRQMHNHTNASVQQSTTEHVLYAYEGII